VVRCGGWKEEGAEEGGGVVVMGGKILREDGMKYRKS
jgi:hypothetical protein